MPEQIPQLDEDGFPAFEPVRIYDAPATILTQIADGEGSLGRAIRTIMAQESLSPAERDSYAQRLKKSYGGNPLADLAIDLGTNPLVWLLATVSPIGRKQFLASEGRLLAGMSDMRKGGFTNRQFVKIAESLRTLGGVGLISATETQAPSIIVQAMQSRLQKFQKEEARIIGPARARLLKKLGIDDFDPSRSNDPLLRELNVQLHYWGSGHADKATYNLPNVFDTVAAKVRSARVEAKTGAKIFDGPESGLTLPQSVVNELEKSKVGLKPGARFALGDAEYEIVDAVRVVNESTLEQARQFFPKAKAGEKMGVHKSAVKYATVEDDFNNLLHVEGYDRNAILEWARDNNIEREFLEYAQASEKLRNHFKTRLFGKLNPDGSVPPTFTLDSDKVLRIYSQYQKTQGNPEMLAERIALQETVGGQFFDVMDKILPGWVKKEIRKGNYRIDRSQVDEVLSKYLTPQLDSPYLSRNTGVLFGRGEMGRATPLGPTHTDALMRRREQGLSYDEVNGIVLPRSKKDLFYNPEDLRVLQDLASRYGPRTDKAKVFVPGSAVGDGPVDLGRFISSTDESIRKAVGTQRRVYALSMDHELSMRKYMRDSQAMITLHAQAIPDNLWGVLEKAIRTPARKLAGAEGRKLAADSEALRALKELGVQEEDLKFLDTQSGTAPEVLTAIPALQARWDDLQKMKSTLPVLKGKARDTLAAKIVAAEKRLDKLASVTSPDDVTLLNKAMRRDISMADALRITLPRESLEVQEHFKLHTLPSLFGGAKPASLVALRGAQHARQLAGRFVDTGMAKWLEANGGQIGKDMIRTFRDYSTKSGYELDAAYRASGLTGYLYATHLGFNVVSAMWNAMQPFQWATTWMGGREILSAYGTALKQLGSYTKERVTKYGVGPLDPHIRQQLWNKHVRTSNLFGRDLLGLTDDIVSSMDSAAISQPLQTKPNLFKYLTVDAPLKLFQKAEELNRIVIAEAGLKWYERMQRESGLRMSMNEVLDQVQVMQSLVNFSPSPTTQLQMFQRGFLANPMMRMFMQYPLRSVSNVLVGQQLGGGVREFGVGPLKTEIPAFIGDLSRMFGTGAVIYEIGKNVLNLDLTSGLGAAAVTQLPGQIAIGNLPLPPTVDIPVKLLKGIATQDMDQFRQAAFRLLPGGLALQKTLGVLPEIPGIGGSYGIVQSQYADWSNKNEQGLVPVYQSDGTLQGFQSPLELVMRGIGADFKKHQSPQEATKFLLANRAQMVELRRRYKDAVLGNNMSLAMNIEGEYRKRYGVPMTVKPGEWDRAVFMREASVSERMLDTMPADVRGIYQQSLEGAAFAPAMGLPVGGLSQGETAKQRASIRGFNVDVVNPAEGQ